MIYDRDEYAKRWHQDASCLFDIGLYEWAESPFEKYLKVLEVGCGTGPSSFTLVAKDHKVFAIDKNPQCIAMCKEYIENNNFSVKEIKITDCMEFSDDDVTLLNIDMLSDVNARLLSYLNPEIIILWNPGGWDAYSGNYHSAWEQQENLIDRVIDYAERKEIPFSILNRFASPNEACKFWEDLKTRTCYSLCCTDYQIVDMSVVDGIPLFSENGYVKKVVYSYGFFNTEPEN